MLREASYRGCGLLVCTVTLVLVGTLSHPATTSGEPNCKPGLEFWVAELSRCLPCRKCEPEITLRPCVLEKDAVCGPLSSLEVNWSLLSSRKRPDETSDESEVAGDVVETKGFPSKRDERPHSRGRRGSGDDGNIPWDWQTAAFALAVCACIVFFLVAGCSAFIYARQWRRMKRSFEPAGLEEISARLNLMVKAELAELAAGAPMSPGDPETRCQYLEKLLDRKRNTPVVAGSRREEGGNLYIEEEGEAEDIPRSKRAQIAQIHRNIESILSHKAKAAKARTRGRMSRD